MSDQTRTYHRIGHDGEWERISISEWPPYKSAREAMTMIADAFERTANLPPLEREAELMRVAELVELI